MEKISWTAKVSNSEVLNRVEENRCIINTINQQKRRWLGHVLWHDVLLRDILKGRMTGKCTRGRKRLQLMSNICEGYETAKKRAEDRCLWCITVMEFNDLLNSRIRWNGIPIITCADNNVNWLTCPVSYLPCNFGLSRTPTSANLTHIHTHNHFTALWTLSGTTQVSW